MKAPPNKRGEGRANVFLSAVLDTGTQTFAIRIRNISEHGALIDGPNIPAARVQVLLVRGSLNARGQIAWRENGQAGISFDQAVIPSAWVAKAGHPGQQRVDDIVAAIRRSDTQPQNSFEDERSLKELSTTLDEICERLGTFPEITIALGEELVRLDDVAQSLRRISMTARPSAGRR